MASLEETIHEDEELLPVIFQYRMCSLADMVGDETFIVRYVHRRHPIDPDACFAVQGIYRFSSLGT